MNHVSNWWQSRGLLRQLGMLLVCVMALICCFMTVVALIIPGDGRVAERTPRPAATDGPTAAPTDTPLPTDTPPPTATLPPEEALKQAIETELGDNNRDVVPMVASFSFDATTGVVDVQWAINDNFTDDMRILGAKLDVSAILQQVQQSALPYTSVHAIGTFSLVDTFGNVSEQTVVDVTYLRETIEKINWENFLTDNMFEIADAAILHPEFR